MIGGYLIAAVIISLLIFFVKQKSLNYGLSAVFSICQVALAWYGWKHLDEVDTMFFRFDGLGVIFTAVLAILNISTLVHTVSYFKRQDGTAKDESRYMAGLTMMTAVMTGAYFSESLGMMWAFIEASTLIISFLVYHEKTAHALEATWKYLFICSIGIAIAFVGVLFMSIVASEGGLNDLDFTALITHADEFDPTWLKIAFMLVLTGYSAKFGLVPFFTVGIDAKGVAPDPIAGLMSTALVNMGFLGIFRIYEIIAQTSAHQWADKVLLIIGFLSIAVAAVQMMRVRQVKRLLAFSSVEHVGIVALALAAGGIGYYIAILHLILHSFAKVVMFYQAGQMRWYYSGYSVHKMGDYFKLNPTGGLIVVLGLLCIMAIPPSGLFFTELMTFSALINKGHYLFSVIVLLFLTLIIYAITKYFLKVLFEKNTQGQVIPGHRPSKIEYAVQLALLAMVVYLGFHQPDVLTDLINSSISLLDHTP